MALDIDAGLRIGPLARRPQALPAPRRHEVIAFARAVVRPRLPLVGVMTYEGQVAGVPD